MSRNGWETTVVLSTHPAITELIRNGCQFYHKGELNLIWNPFEPQPDGTWLHASVSHPYRYPSWNEILDIRYTFFPDTADVFQILPPKSEYVNLHPNCFHLWSPVGRRIMPR